MSTSVPVTQIAPPPLKKKSNTVWWVILGIFIVIILIIIIYFVYKYMKKGGGGGGGGGDKPKTAWQLVSTRTPNEESRVWANQITEKILGFKEDGGVVTTITNRIDKLSALTNEGADMICGDLCFHYGPSTTAAPKIKESLAKMCSCTAGKVTAIGFI